MRKTTKMAEIEQLLKDYVAYHYPSSLQGTMNTEAQRPGPGSWPLAKLQYLERSPLLKKTYEHLDRALEQLRREHWPEWLLIRTAYLDPDTSPSKVAHWRKLAKDHLGARLQLEMLEDGIRTLARYLADVELHVIWPQRMTSREEKQVERRNDELYAVYLRHREEGTSRGKAIEKAATECGYSPGRASKIVKLRESSKEKS